MFRLSHPSGRPVVAFDLSLGLALVEFRSFPRSVGWLLVRVEALKQRDSRDRSATSRRFQKVSDAVTVSRIFESHACTRTYKGRTTLRRRLIDSRVIDWRFSVIDRLFPFSYDCRNPDIYVTPIYQHTCMATTTEGATQSNQASTSGITLLDGEYVLENEHPSWSSWWKSLLVGAIFALSTLSSAVQGDLGTATTGLVIAAVIFGYVYYSRSRSRYIVTNQRVKKDVGLLRSSTGEVRITDIRSLNTGQGLIERIWGKGTVKIDSGGAGGELGISGVSDHEELAHTIREQQRQVED